MLFPVDGVLPGGLSPTEYSLPGPNHPRDDADDGCTVSRRGHPLPPPSFQNLYPLITLVSKLFSFST